MGRWWGGGKEGLICGDVMCRRCGDAAKDGRKGEEEMTIKDGEGKSSREKVYRRSDSGLAKGDVDERRKV